jgi:hypothetical protein
VIQGVCIIFRSECTILDLRYNGILPELMDKRRDFRVEKAGAAALTTVAEPGTVLAEDFLLWVYESVVMRQSIMPSQFVSQVNPLQRRCINDSSKKSF